MKILRNKQKIDDKEFEFTLRKRFIRISNNVMENKTFRFLNATEALDKLIIRTIETDIIMKTKNVMSI